MQHDSPPMIHASVDIHTASRLSRDWSSCKHCIWQSFKKTIHLSFLKETRWLNSRPMKSIAKSIIQIPFPDISQCWNLPSDERQGFVQRALSHEIQSRCGFGGWGYCRSRDSNFYAILDFQVVGRGLHPCWGFFEARLTSLWRSHSLDVDTAFPTW